jgi:hypothetical protein
MYHIYNLTLMQSLVHIFQLHAGAVDGSIYASGEHIHFHPGTAYTGMDSDAILIADATESARSVSLRRDSK